MATYPFSRVEVQVFDVAMLEKASQANAVVCEMRLFADNDNIVFSPLDIVFHEFLTVSGQLQYALSVEWRTCMKAMPTMPSPTTTIRFRGWSELISPLLSKSATFSGSLLASASFHCALDMFPSFDPQVAVT